MTVAFEPAQAPRFGPAARAMIDTLRNQPTADARTEALHQLCQELGNDWFSFFIKLLMVVGEGAPEADRRLLAETLAHGLKQGQPAAGTLSSWGIPSNLPPAVTGVAGNMFLRRAQARPLDPLSYLAVWYSQGTARPRLTAEGFQRAVVAVLRLFSVSTVATAIYQAKLRADLLAAADGTYSATTLRRLQQLVDGWCAGQAAPALAAELAADDRSPPLQGARLAAGHRFV
jgi:hypothetical protein